MNKIATGGLYAGNALFETEHTSIIPQKILVNKDHWNSLQADALIGKAFREGHKELSCGGRYDEDDCDFCELGEACKLIPKEETK